MIILKELDGRDAERLFQWSIDRLCEIFTRLAAWRNGHAARPYIFYGMRGQGNAREYSYHLQRQICCILGEDWAEFSGFKLGDELGALYFDTKMIKVRAIGVWPLTEILC